jgi:PAS domain-containing protein
MLVTKAISIEADEALSLSKTELLDQIRWMQLITDNVAANIAYIDADQRFLFVNKGVGELLGLAREDIFGRRKQPSAAKRGPSNRNDYRPREGGCTS